MMNGYNGNLRFLPRTLKKKRVKKELFIGIALGIIISFAVSAILILLLIFINV